MMADEAGYNGWKNYETWVMALWIDNDEGSYTYSREIVRETIATETEADQGMIRVMVADQLKDWQEQVMPAWTGEASVWVDLMNAAFSEVDWFEIAENYLSELSNA